MTRLSAIFATGMVAAQRKNFALCMEFLERLAGVGGEEKRPRIRQRLLAQPCVAEFKSRWNLPIYFQLRCGPESMHDVFTVLHLAHIFYRSHCFPLDDLDVSRQVFS